MDEMTKLQEFRSEITVTAPGRLPDFLERGGVAIDGGVLPGSQRKSLLLGGAGAAVAASLVVGLLVAQAGPGASPSAAEVLDQAADRVAARPEVRPRDDQWVYESFVHDSADAPRKEMWVRFDGTKYANNQPEGSSRLVVTEEEKGTTDPAPKEWYDELAALPEDPHALLVQLRTSDLVDHTVPSTEAVSDFANVAECLLAAPVLPPQAQARLFRALATIPGVEVDADAHDLLGRSVLSVAWTGGNQEGIDPDESVELLLDPSTYAALGQRSTLLQDESGGPSKGDITFDVAYSATGVVDQPGQRP
ncbi:MAG: CU044_5270 family protein [Aeromicrobium sp.]